MWDEANIEEKNSRFWGGSRPSHVAKQLSGISTIRFLPSRSKFQYCPRINAMPEKSSAVFNRQIVTTVRRHIERACERKEFEMPYGISDGKKKSTLYKRSIALFPARLQ
jgi:hypothetical protein